MFDLEELQKKTAVKSAAADLLLDMLLNDSDMPEERKVELRILKVHNLLGEVTREFSEKYAVYTCGSSSPELYKVQKEALDYLTMVVQGIRQFMEATPLPVSTDSTTKDDEQ